MNILFFDTETNGLPRDWRAPVSDVKNWPRVIQLAWCLTDLEGNEISSRVDLIKPDGWEIPNEPFWINNGFSQAKSEAEGISIEEALGHFVVAVDTCSLIVAHNMAFDQKVVGAELLRLKWRRGGPLKEKVCTMRVSTDLMKMPGRYEGSYKYPKLEELHRWLFAEDFDGAHDAMADVRACMRCFFELKNRRHIVVEHAESIPNV